jgi:hypothetical protein
MPDNWPLFHSATLVNASTFGSHQTENYLTAFRVGLTVTFS